MALYSSLNKSILDCVEDGNKPRYDGVGLKAAGGIIHEGNLYQGVEILGRKNLIYTYETNCFPEAGIAGAGIGDINYRSPTGEQYRFVSTSANDTAAGSRCQSLFVFGIDPTFAQVFEILPLNGLTPVTTANTYLRLTAAVIYTSGTPNSLTASVNEGFIYCTANAATFTAGVPNDRTHIVGVMSPNTGAMDVCMLTVPPGSALYLSELVIASSVGGKDDNIFINIRGNQGTGWTNFGTLSASTSLPIVSLHQGGFPNLVNPTKAEPLDVVLTVRREGGSGTTDNLSVNLFMTGQLVVPLP